MSAAREILAGTDKNKISTMRVSVLIITIVILGVYVAHNIMAMVAGNGLVSLGWDQVIVLTTILGAKALQHKSEVSKQTVTFSSSVSNGSSSKIEADDKDLSNSN